MILHSDQGSQYTSRAFTEFCESAHVIRSISRAGYPYDNAPMERYFNTLKSECTNLYAFKTEEELSRVVEEFAYATYNHVRPTATTAIGHHIRHGCHTLLRRQYLTAHTLGGNRKDVLNKYIDMLDSTAFVIVSYQDFPIEREITKAKV